MYVFSSIHMNSHLDHVGALPYFTERAGYDGPVYMTVCFLYAIIFLNNALDHVFFSIINSIQQER